MTTNIVISLGILAFLIFTGLVYTFFASHNNNRKYTILEVAFDMVTYFVLFTQILLLGIALLFVIFL